MSLHKKFLRWRLLNMYYRLVSLYFVIALACKLSGMSVLKLSVLTPFFLVWVTLDPS